MMDAKRETLFWSKAERIGDCLAWTAAKSEKGYGKFGIGRRSYRAHRVAYELTHGAIPEGIQIDHTCHNPSCILPDHLRATTHKQNQENRAGAARTNISGVRGVHWHSQSRRWRASITHNGKNIYLGMFGTIEEAEPIVLAKRLELFTHNDADRSRPTRAAFLVKGADQ